MVSCFSHYFAKQVQNRGNRDPVSRETIAYKPKNHADRSLGDGMVDERPALKS